MSLSKVGRLTETTPAASLRLNNTCSTGLASFGSPSLIEPTLSLRAENGPEEGLECYRTNEQEALREGGLLLDGGED